MSLKYYKSRKEKYTEDKDFKKQIQEKAPPPKKSYVLNKEVHEKVNLRGDKWLSFYRKCRRNVGIATVFLIIVFAVTSDTATVRSQETEIKYDDGEAEELLSLPRPDLGGMYAVRFTPVYTPCLLTAARCFISDPLLDLRKEPAVPFKVRILDSSRKYILFELTVTPSSSGWCDVDLAQQKINIDGDFYIAYMQTVTGRPGGLGFDTNSPDGRSWFVSKTGEWKPSARATAESGYPDGDFMIRAVVQPIEATKPSQTISTPTPTSTATPTSTVTEAPGTQVLGGYIAIVGTIGVAIVIVLVFVFRKEKPSTLGAPTSSPTFQAIRKCWRCGAEPPPDADYCLECGEKITK